MTKSGHNLRYESFNLIDTRNSSTCGRMLAQGNAGNAYPNFIHYFCAAVVTLYLQISSQKKGMECGKEFKLNDAERSVLRI